MSQDVLAERMAKAIRQELGRFTWYGLVDRHDWQDAITAAVAPVALRVVEEVWHVRHLCCDDVASSEARIAELERLNAERARQQAILHHERDEWRQRCDEARERAQALRAGVRDAIKHHSAAYNPDLGLLALLRALLGAK